MKRIGSKVAQASLVIGMLMGCGDADLVATSDGYDDSTDATKSYTKCAEEWNACSFTGTRVVRFGATGHYVYKSFTDGALCVSEAFGRDSYAGASRDCAVADEPSVEPAPVVRADAATPPVTVKPDAGTPPVAAKPDAGMPPVVVAPADAGTPPEVTPPDAPLPIIKPAPPVDGSAVKRPSESLGTGFFVSNGKLYDANGNEFRMRGVNKVHWDNTSLGLNNANANATRWTVDFNRRPADNLALLQGSTGSAGTVAKQHVVIPGNWDGTCKDDPSYLTKMVDTWVAQAASWKQLEKFMILNIANEWGPGGDGTVWRDANIAAVKRLRDAGYHATISVTAGGCGQDPNSIVKWGKAVFDSDPEKNVIFDQHIYGVYSDAAGGATGSYKNQPDLEAQTKALAATGLVVVLGEFGPGHNVGPSPTMIKPERVIELSEKYNLGWLAWAWDDNNLAGGQSNDDSFSMSYSGGYSKSADLTTFGRIVVEDAKWGLKVLAKPASIFK